MEYDKESLEQIANLEVVDIETGIDYHNRVRLRLENGVCILADIVKIQTPDERLIELNDAKAKVTQLETIYSVLRDGTVSF